MALPMNHLTVFLLVFSFSFLEASQCKHLKSILHKSSWKQLGGLKLFLMCSTKVVEERNTNKVDVLIHCRVFKTSPVNLSLFYSTAGL